jgi:tungstate transport system substrate-binding protein
MKKAVVSSILIAVVLLAVAVIAEAQQPTKVLRDPKDKDVILSTTTSTQDSGLLNELIPLFEKQSGYRVKTVAVGTGQALAMAAKGEADVVLVHAPSLETKYVALGKLLNRRVVMYNDFIIIGPSNDPAKIKSAKTAVAALKLIEQSQAPFVSRGDNSGTHNFEKSLWKSAGIMPKGAWYVAGSGNGGDAQHRQ